MEWDAPHGIGRKRHNPSPPREEMGFPSEDRKKYQNPSLGPNEMSELLSAPE
jgi:hypothetical protein